MHVSSDKGSRLRDSTDSAVGITAQDYKEREVIWPCHATLYSKKRKAGQRKFSLDFFSNLFYIYYMFIFIFYFSLYFNVFFELQSTLDMLPSTLDILPSTLDPQQLDTFSSNQVITVNHKSWPYLTLTKFLSYPFWCMPGLFGAISVQYHKNVRRVCCGFLFR